MEQLPSLISDLALILMVAGFVALLFKRLRQPLVLGYIVAGFLVGPNMPWMPSVTDAESVKTWSDIGVIFLMFSLGLEFSFKKILKMGSGPVVAACCVMGCMIGVGNGVGRLFGWAGMDAMFLGGMLAMSSTTIIYKALDDLNMRRKKFASEVLSVLILEDILGILLMVVLSALAVSREFEGMQLAGSLLKLGFFLILWFIVGIYVIPQLLKRTRLLMSGETLLIVSVGLCFLMVFLADGAGYSSAFGAFMMGSILAETLEAERIDRVLTPLKDLFGAIFFVSVGMMVNPSVLAEHWSSVLMIVIAVVCGQALLGTLSFLISGQSLKIAMQCGFSMAQIGEFAFIIATLGVSLGVTSPFLYPIVVAVSIITTFLTPYMIKAAAPAYALLERKLPDTLLARLGNDTEKEASATDTAHEKTLVALWRQLLLSLVAQIAVYGVLSTAAVAISLSALLPVCRSTFTHWPGNAVCGIVTLAAISPFLRAIVMRKHRTKAALLLRRRGWLHGIGVDLLLVARFLIASWFVYYVLEYLSPCSWLLHAGIAFVLVGLMIASRRLKYTSIRMERTFTQNLRLRDMHRARKQPAFARKLQAHDLHAVELEVPQGSLWAGRSLRQLKFSKSDGITIAAITRGGVRRNIPEASAVVYPGDRLTVIGDDSGVERFTARMTDEVQQSGTISIQPLLLRRIFLKDHPQLVGRTLGESGIKEDYQCLVVGFEGEGGSLDVPSAKRVLRRSDTLWLVGEEEALQKLGARR